MNIESKSIRRFCLLEQLLHLKKLALQGAVLFPQPLVFSLGSQQLALQVLHLTLLPESRTLGAQPILEETLPRLFVDLVQIVGQALLSLYQRSCLLRSKVSWNRSDRRNLRRRNRKALEIR